MAFEKDFIFIFDDPISKKFDIKKNSSQIILYEDVHSTAGVNIEIHVNCGSKHGNK